MLAILSAKWIVDNFNLIVMKVILQIHYWSPMSRAPIWFNVSVIPRDVCLTAWTGNCKNAQLFLFFSLSDQFRENKFLKFSLTFTVNRGVIRVRQFLKILNRFLLRNFQNFICIPKRIWCNKGTWGSVVIKFISYCLNSNRSKLILWTHVLCPHLLT